MNFSWWTFALQVANFLILVWLLQRFLFKPVKAIVARRKQEISYALAEASREKEDVEGLKREVEAQRSGIEAERQRIIEEERMQLAAERRKILEETRGEAETIREQALKRLDEERAAAGDELFERTVILATNLAERLLRELAGSSLEQLFLERVIRYLDQLSAEERAKLSPRPGADTLSVTTAHPLGAEARSEWREQLVSHLGAHRSIEFNADPSLIAGAVIAFPDAILRFNWRDSLTAALKELHSHG